MNASATYRCLPPQLAERLRGLKLLAKRPVEGQMQGLHRSPHFGASVEFAEFREYSPGDPPGWIDWAVYARSDRYMIRRYQEETNLRAYVLLDTSESLAFQGRGPVSKLDYAVSLAAALMFILVQQGDAVGLMTFDSDLRKSFAPTGSFDGLRPLLLALEQLRPAGRSDIEAALHQAAGLIKSRSMIILISDLLQTPAAVLRGLRHLHHNGHDLTVLHVLDGGELQLGFHGLTELRELESGRRLIIEPDELRGAYAREVQRYLDELRLGCVDCRAEYQLVLTDMPIHEAVHRRAIRA